MTPEAYCHNIVKQSHSHFQLSFYFVHKNQRKGMIALYAFCRVIDDLVDNAKELDIARVKIHWWQNAINNLFKGKAEHPICQALLPVIEAFKLPQQPFDDMLKGVTMDLDKQHYDNFEALRSYCYCVASTVGLLTARILGYQNPQTLVYAENLGIALQLINIIRDVGEDITRGRIYLPQDELEQFSIANQAIIDLHYTEDFKALQSFQANRARSYYHAAMQALPAEDRKPQKIGLIMANSYLKLLNIIEKEGFNTLQYRYSLGPISRITSALITLFSESRPFKPSPA